MVPVSNEGYLGLIRDLASDLEAVRWGDKATTFKLAERKAILHKLKLKVQLFTGEAGRAGDL